MSPFTKQACYS